MLCNLTLKFVNTADKWPILGLLEDAGVSFSCVVDSASYNVWDRTARTYTIHCEGNLNLETLKGIYNILKKNDEEHS